MSFINRKFYCVAALMLATTWCVGQSLTRHVLFLGNSYTYTNNMPQLVANVAQSTGDTLVFDMHAPGGYTLWDHYNDSISTGMIEAGGWDYVVLQEQSQLPAFDIYDDFYGVYLSQFTRVHNPCARSLFYMTWGRENGDASNCADYPQMCTYESMDSIIAVRYTEMAQASEAEVSPVSRVWKHIKQNYPSIDLYQSDGSHPTLTGSYLIACCFYTSIFKKDPTLITYAPTIDTAQALTIRQTTKAILFDSLANWDFTNSIPTAGFNYVVGTGTNEIIFTNTSINADSYLWDFGDGTASTEENPTHNYANNGNYIITLTATNCDLTINHQSIHVDSVSFCSYTPTISPNDLILCPNSSDTLWTQPYDSYQWYNANGDAIPNATNQFFVPQPGLYSVMAMENNCSEMSQQVFVDAAANATFYVEGVGNSGIFGLGCIGDTVYLSVATTWLLAPDLSPFVNWYLDSVLLPLPPNDSLMITESGMYGVTVEHPSCPGFIAAQYLNINFQFIDCGTGLPNTSHLPPINMFPNPASEYVTVENNRSDNVNFSIFDATGRLVVSGTARTGENNIWVNELANGVYIVKFDRWDLQPLKLIKL